MKAKRIKPRVVAVEIEVISRRLCTDSCPAGLWQSLKRKCVICGGKFPVGCSITMVMYIEDGQQKSGGVHTECLDGENQ